MGALGSTVVSPRQPAVFIAGDRYRRHSYGSNHPLGIPRVSLTADLIRAYGAFDDGEYVESRMASDEELLWFHTPEYIEALRESEKAGRVNDVYRQRHNIGNFENPYFPGFFTTPATAAGGSILAAEAVLAGSIGFNPPGGMHHGLPDQARGFCFINDPALAILRLRREGYRVLYVDIDAHHGDGVEYAFANDPHVVTFSLHMATTYAYPFKGGDWSDWGALGNAVNVPLPKNTNDSEYRYAFDAIWSPLVEIVRPDAIVLQAGTDMLFADPLGKFDISTEFFLEVIRKIMEHAPRNESGNPKLAVLGGGGYHPIALARCWTGVWALLSGRELSAELPESARVLLRNVDWDQDEEADYFGMLFETRLDPPREGEIRADIVATTEALLANHPIFSRRPFVVGKQW